ncbi:hypothetical protein CMV_025873 [Castanea mollissima]|uniref:Uncharacterized protein n=1 Tax=Castanea mollissima TaxID=60419 RepID=A0A8J4QDF7_9ROSI|nr:hypothetical protein CMV_025873 [Castanea mollissima]
MKALVEVAVGREVVVQTPTLQLTMTDQAEAHIDRNGCGSSSVLNDTELPPFQPVFPTSYGLKGFLGDLNVSLSAPNNSELLALLPGPNMDHEVSNTVNDLRLLKGIHNDGCDSDERESEPPLFPDSTNGFDFGFAQPNLELGSSVSGGFHLGSSSMAHACNIPEDIVAPFSTKLPGLVAVK